MNNKKFKDKLYEAEYVETIKELIDNSSMINKDRPAYYYKDKHGEEFKAITYGEFKDKMTCLGTKLIDMGLKGSKVAIIAENSYKWVLSYFSVVCGVGTIVPIDMNLESGEIENLLTRADVELIFTSKKTAEKVIGIKEKVETLKYIVTLDDIEEEDTLLLSDMLSHGRKLLNEGNRKYIEAVVEPEDISTILFTSGTTGLAKGVMLSHRNLVQNVYNMSKYVHIKEHGIVLDVLPMNHVYEMTCSVMTCYYQGLTIAICEGLKYIQKNFVEIGACTMLGVPLIFENIYRKIWNKAEKTGNAERLRRAINISKRFNLKNNKTVTKRMFQAIHDIFGDELYLLIVGGAAINPQVVEDFEAMGIPIIQGYGMSENAPIIAVNRDRYSKPASVGKPMPGTEVKLIGKDENGIGEIICKGPSVMKGYYKDPESTEETIIDGWLQTGDYGYFDEEGFLYITGRKKNVIVTKGGKNIFPEEVEYYLLLNHAVEDTIVYGKHEDIKGNLICTALIYPDYQYLKDKGITEDVDIYKYISGIVDEANEKMPPYKRVKRIEIRENAFIKTTTLKIKRFEEGNYEYKYDDRHIEK